MEASEGRDTPRPDASSKAPAEAPVGRRSALDGRVATVMQIGRTMFGRRKGRPLRDPR